MLNVKKLSKEEMKLITASGTVAGGSSNSGNTSCGTEPDPVTEPIVHEYWKDCMESNGKPVICPPGDSPTNF